jgi:hypothetical protein
MGSMTEQQTGGCPVAEQRISLNDGQTIPAIGFGTSVIPVFADDP